MEAGGVGSSADLMATCLLTRSAHVDSGVSSEEAMLVTSVVSSSFSAAGLGLLGWFR